MATLPEIDQKLEELTKKFEIDTAVFALASALIEKVGVFVDGIKQAVVPSIPEMINDITDEIESGSVDRFEKAIDRLNKQVNTLGIDLGNYNKDLAKFLKEREEKIQKSEQEIIEVRKGGVVAEINRFSGEIELLTREEIKQKNQSLLFTNKQIKNTENEIERQRKILQERRFVTNEDRELAKQEIIEKQNYLKEQQTTREKLLETLGSRADDRQPGLFERARGGTERAGEGLREYVPAPILDTISAFTETLTAPFTAIKEFGLQIGEFLKPLKLVVDLFKPLLLGLKRFVASLAASVVAFLPFLAIATAVAVVLGGLFYAIKKIADFFGVSDEGLEPGTSNFRGGAGDTMGEAYLPEETYNAPVNEKPVIKPMSMDTGDVITQPKIYAPGTKDQNLITPDKLEELKKSAPSFEIAKGGNNTAVANSVANTAINNSVSSVSLRGSMNDDTWFNKTVGV